MCTDRIMSSNVRLDTWFFKPHGTEILDGIFSVIPRTA